MLEPVNISLESLNLVTLYPKKELLPLVSSTYSYNQYLLVIGFPCKYLSPRMMQNFYHNFLNVLQSLN